MTSAQPVISVTATSPDGPVAMASVTVESAPRSVPDVAALTGTDGRATLGTVGPGSYVIAVHASGFESAHVECEAGSIDHDIEVQLVPKC
jgi:Carboxypeptidase regulatory-like domain